MKTNRSFAFSYLLNAFALLAIVTATPALAGTGADPYRSWAASQFGSAAVADSSQEFTRWGESADPDGDGLSNLLEYALGLDPQSPSLSPTPFQVPVTWLTGDQSAFVIAATIRADDPDLVVFPQVSVDNSSWFPFVLDRSDLGTADNFYTVKVDESVPARGLKQITWASRPTGTGLDPHFMRLTAIRQGTMSNSAAPQPSSSDVVQPSLPSLASTPTIPGLAFTGQLHAGVGADLISNTVTLRGFKGNVQVTAPDGVTLLVNGNAVDGQSAMVKAGDTLAMRAKAPTVAAKPATYSLKVGASNTAEWTVASQAAAPLAAAAGTVSGYTPVSTSVGPSGDANIAIPITVSPGIGGMEPKLSIVYNSQGGNGLLGIGFNLGGLSAISRVGRTIAQDGKRGSVKLNVDDRFALDGARLISTSGPDGGDGTTYEKELTDFSRIRSFGSAGTGPATWKVETKSGLTYEYGGNGQAPVKLDNHAETLVWPVTRIVDTVGNEMWFSYTVTNGTCRISRIDYTCRGGVGNNPTSNWVGFTYETRPDVQTAYLLGSKIVVDQRLKAIGALHGAQIVRRYALNYQSSKNSSRSQLKDVSEAGQGGVAFESTKFTWNGGLTEHTSLKSDPSLDNLTYSKSPPSVMAQGDFNGDGRMDIFHVNEHPSECYIAFGQSDGTFVRRSSPAEFATVGAVDRSGNVTYSKLRTGDFNGDGKTDLLHLTRSAGNNWVAYARADGSFEVHSGNDLGVLKNVGHSGDFESEFVMLDLNSDGRSDVVSMHGDGNNRVFLCTGNKTDAFREVSPGAGFSQVKISNNDESNTWLLPGDYNGDGLADLLVMYYLGSAWLALSNGDGSFTVRTGAELGGMASLPFSRRYSYMVSADFNGDGLTDVANFDDHLTNGKSVFMAIARGDGTFEVTYPPTLQGLPASNSGGAYTHLSAGDFNGDGVADFLNVYFPSSADSFLAFGAGDTSFSILRNGKMGALDSQTYSTGNPPSRVFIGDFDGDGRDDVLQSSYGGSHWLARSNGYSSDRVDQVTNGHGGYTRFEYKPMTDASVYTIGTTAPADAYPFQAPMQMVSKMVSRNGNDGDPDNPSAPAPAAETAISYHYYESIAYTNGRGLLPPAIVRELNETTGITTTTYHNTTDPLLAGSPAEVLVRLGNGVKINHTLNTWTLGNRNAVANHRTYFPFAAKVEKLDFDVDHSGSVVRRTMTYIPAKNTSGLGYDSNGNLLSSSETITSDSVPTAGTFTTSTANTYKDNTGTPYILGRLTSSTVTKTAPNSSPSVRTSTFIYNQTTGLLGVETIEPGNPRLQIDKVYKRDTFGNITDSSETAWNGVGAPALNQTRSKHTDYSTDGRFITRTVNALGHVELTEHEPLLGQVTHQTGPNKIETFWEFDGFGRPTRERRADGTETISSYLSATPGQDGAPARAVHRVVSANTGSAPKTVWFDVLDREIRRDTVGFDGSKISVRKIFDERGLVIRSSNPFFAGQTPSDTVMKYDLIGREYQRTLPGNFDNFMSYNGLTTTVKNSEGQTHTRTATLLDKLDAAVDAYNHPIDYTHDAAGNLSVVTDSKSNKTNLAYDNRGNKTSMVEPNSGKTTYEYDGFGELISQTNSANQRTTFSYDLLGRMIKRVEPDGTTTWTYDNFPNRPPGDALTGHSLGKLVRVEQGEYREDHVYDSFGRPSETTTTIATESFRTRTTYDFAGRVETLTYPTAFAIRNVYNTNGYLAEVQNATNAGTFWKAVQVNARGQIEKESLGNSVTTERTFDPNNGLVLRIRTGKGTANLGEIQNLAFNYNSIGTLVSRQDAGRNYSETFSYDKVNRLTDSQLTGASSDFPNVHVGYDELGNPVSRTDAGSFTYSPTSQPNAVHALLSRPGGAPDLRYTYDVRGNRTKTERRSGSSWVTDLTIGYTTANLPNILTTPNPPTGQKTTTTTFNYGPDRARYRQVEQIGGTIYMGRLYIGSLYEREKRFASGALTATRHVHYVPAGSGFIAIKQMEEGAGAAFGERTQYVHKDHLGSVESLSNQAGASAEQFSYDAWGRRRTVTLANGAYRLSYKPNTALIAVNTARGFTGHEMLDAFGLVHMNGRLYDPLTGRFLSADPIVQELDNLQNLNRYSYVLNNPLSMTDPSGFSFFKKWWRQIVTAVVAVVITIAAPYLLPAMSTFWTAVATGAAAGFGGAFTGTLLAGGSIGDAFRAGIIGGIIGGVTAGALAKIDQFNPDWLDGTIPGEGQDWFTRARVVNQLERMGERAVIRGAASELQGGSFSRGAEFSLAGDSAKWGEELIIESRYRYETNPHSPGYGKHGEGIGNKKFKENDLKKGSLSYSRGRLPSGRDDIKGSDEAAVSFEISNPGRGFNNQGGFFQEGGPAMRVLRDVVPGLDAVGNAHDSFVVWSHLDKIDVLNVGTNAFYIPLTEVALTTTLSEPALSPLRDRKQR